MEARTVYLDNASTSWPKPESVYRYMIDSYRRTGVAPGRGSAGRAVEAGALVESLRVRLTRLFGGDADAPERLCFCYNTTDALNLIINGLLSAGDHVVTSALEHNSVLRPINHLARDGGVSATFVRFGASGVIDPGDVARAIRPNTRLVILGHGSNVLGTVQPLAEVGAICRQHGVVLATDAAQTAGSIAIDMDRMNIGVLAFPGHKALLGSMGIGGLCVRKGVEIRQVRSGGTGVRSAEPYQPDEYPWRMECGTPNMLGIAALSAAQDWLDAQGVDAIHRREMKLAERLVEGLRAIEGVRLYCCDNLRDHLPTISANIEGLGAVEAGSRLEAEYGVMTRAGLHCAPRVHEQLGTLASGGTIRFSIGPFNSEADIETAIAAMAAITRGHRPSSGSQPLVAYGQAGGAGSSPVRDGSFGD